MEKCEDWTGLILRSYVTARTAVWLIFGPVLQYVWSKQFAVLRKKHSWSRLKDVSGTGQDQLQEQTVLGVADLSLVACCALVGSGRVVAFTACRVRRDDVRVSLRSLGDCSIYVWAPAHRPGPFRLLPFDLHTRGLLCSLQFAPLWVFTCSMMFAVCKHQERSSNNNFQHPEGQHTFLLPLFIGGLVNRKAPHYCRLVVWSSSRTGTGSGSVTVNGETTINKTEEKVIPVKITPHLHVAGDPPKKRVSQLILDAVPLPPETHLLILLHPRCSHAAFKCPVPLYCTFLSLQTSLWNTEIPPSASLHALSELS